MQPELEQKIGQQSIQGAIEVAEALELQSSQSVPFYCCFVALLLVKGDLVGARFALARCKKSLAASDSAEANNTLTAYSRLLTTMWARAYPDALREATQMRSSLPPQVFQWLVRSIIVRRIGRVQTACNRSDSAIAAELSIPVETVVEAKGDAVVVAVVALGINSCKVAASGWDPTKKLETIAKISTLMAN